MPLFASSIDSSNANYLRSHDLFEARPNSFKVKGMFLPEDTVVPFEAGLFSCQTAGIQDYVVVGLLGVIFTETGKLTQIHGDDFDGEYVKELLDKITAASSYVFRDMSALVVSDPTEVFTGDAPKM